MESTITFTTDGSTTWTYLPRDKAYRRVPAARDSIDDQEADLVAGIKEAVAR